MGGQDRADRVDAELLAAGITPGTRASTRPPIPRTSRRATADGRAGRRRPLHRPAGGLGRRRSATVEPTAGGRPRRRGAAGEPTAPRPSILHAATFPLPGRAGRLRLGRRRAHGRLRRPDLPPRARARGGRHGPVPPPGHPPAPRRPVLPPVDAAGDARAWPARSTSSRSPAGPSASTSWSAATTRGPLVRTADEVVQTLRLDAPAR